jgi:hypothetical protein
MDDYDDNVSTGSSNGYSYGNDSMDDDDDIEHASTLETYNLALWSGVPESKLLSRPERPVHIPASNIQWRNPSDVAPRMVGEDDAAFEVRYLATPLTWMMTPEEVASEEVSQWNLFTSECDRFLHHFISLLQLLHDRLSAFLRFPHHGPSAKRRVQLIGKLEELLYHVPATWVAPRDEDAISQIELSFASTCDESFACVKRLFASSHVDIVAPFCAPPPLSDSDSSNVETQTAPAMLLPVLNTSVVTRPVALVYAGLPPSPREYSSSKTSSGQEEGMMLSRNARKKLARRAAASTGLNPAP